MKNKLALIIILEFLLVTCSFSQWGWFQINSGLTDDINDMDANNNNYWAVGSNGKIISTTNTGTNWVVVPSGTTNDLNAVKFALFSYSAFVAGSNGTVLRSTNSGSTWIVQNSGCSQKLNAIYVLRDTLTVVAVGDNGTILKSTNQGLTWAPKTSSTTNNLYAIIQSYSDVLCAVGAGGTVLVSPDAGEYWIQYPGGTINSLYSIEWYDNLFADMIAVGDNGTIIKTSNGGMNWFPLNSGTTQNLRKIKVLDEYFNQHCQIKYYFVSGSNGTVITSTDLGLSWETRYTPVSVNLNSICFYSLNTGFACGSSGTMIKTVSNHYYQDKRIMDGNNIGTWFANDGSFNRNTGANAPGFEFPRGSGKFSRYASGLDIGAIVEGDTLVAMSYHFANEYYPGYTLGFENPYGRNDSNYRVYKIVSGTNNNDRLRWPNALLGNSDQGAPVYYDNSTSSWKPLDFGSQTMFSVFTDSYPESHSGYAGGTNPLGADIKHLSFSLDTTGVLGNVVFSQYTIINKSPFVWHDAYITLWTDDDIGDPGNDKIGCDSLMRLGYTYNGTGNDTSYSNTPPAVGFLLLRGALVPTGNNSDTIRICQNKTKSYITRARDLGMTVFNFSINIDPNDPDPETYYCMYRVMKGLNIYGYNRYHPQGYATSLVYSGDPVANTGWNQSVYADMRSFLSTGPFNMNPGDTQVIVFAQIIARGSSSLNSVTLLKQYCSVVKQYYDSCYSFIPNGIINQNEIAYEYSLCQNYPNPFNPKTKIVFTIPKRTNVKIEIYDAAGRLVETLADMNFDKGMHSIDWDGTNYASGVYFYKLSTNGYSETKKMVLIK